MQASILSAISHGFRSYRKGREATPQKNSDQALSKAMFLSRTYLAMKFKKDTGMALTDDIMKEKVEEGKRLLRYTDKPVSAIAAYLGFSSQSHFSNVFKKYMDSSPYGYRLKYSRWT